MTSEQYRINSNNPNNNQLGCFMLTVAFALGMAVMWGIFIIKGF